MSTTSALSLFFLIPLLYGTVSPAFLAPITKDTATHKYMLSIYLSTPPHPNNLVLDLGASFTLVECTDNSSPSTYNSIFSFGSSSCRACSLRKGCSNDSRVIHSATQKPPLLSQPIVDSLSMPTTNGLNPGQLGSIPSFVYYCRKRSSLKGLVRGAAGFSGLGRSNLSIPAPVSNSSTENAVFSLCLSGSPSAPGVAFFGSRGPYSFISQIDLSKYIYYIPLLSIPNVGSTVVSYSDPSNEYFIRLTSIKVNGKAIDFNQTLLYFNDKGFGGTKLSTISPYTVLQSTIFTALTEAFVNESAALNLTVTEPVKPFKVCYKADDVTSTHIGPAIPTIDFVLQDDMMWRLFGSNSMARIYHDDVDVWCLGFLDGGAHPNSSIVIGGHQMEDNLLQFDLESKRLGFTSSVLVHGTMCANFNFTV